MKVADKDNKRKLPLMNRPRNDRPVTGFLQEIVQGTPVLKMRATMKYEFRGRTIREAVSKATHPHLAHKDNAARCAQLFNALQRRIEALEEHERDLERVRQRLSRLQSKLDEEADSLFADDAIKVAQIIGAIASLFPAVRAVQTGVRAYRAATSVARALSAGDTIAGAISGISVAGILGLSAFKPSTQRQIENALGEFETLTDRIATRNRSIRQILEHLEREGCTAIEI